MEEQAPKKAPPADFCTMPNGPKRGSNKPALCTMADILGEIAFIYRLFRSGRLSRQDYRDLVNGLRIVKEIAKEHILSDLALDIETLKEAIQHKNDGQEKVKDDDNNQQPNDRSIP